MVVHMVSKHTDFPPSSSSSSSLLSHSLSSHSILSTELMVQEPLPLPLSFHSPRSDRHSVSPFIARPPSLPPFSHLSMTSTTTTSNSRRSSTPPPPSSSFTSPFPLQSSSSSSSPPKRVRRTIRLHPVGTNLVRWKNKIRLQHQTAVRDYNRETEEEEEEDEDEEQEADEENENVEIQKYMDEEDDDDDHRPPHYYHPHQQKNKDKKREKQDDEEKEEHETPVKKKKKGETVMDEKENIKRLKKKKKKKEKTQEKEGSGGTSGDGGEMCKNVQTVLPRVLSPSLLPQQTLSPSVRTVQNWVDFACSVLTSGLPPATTLIATDIDETVWRSRYELPVTTDAAHRHLKWWTRLQQTHGSRVLGAYTDALHEKVVTEPIVPRVLDVLRQHGYSIFGLTSRTIEQRGVTLKSLSTLQLEFCNHPFPIRYFFFFF